jgi:hypothetical protein
MAAEEPWEPLKSDDVIRVTIKAGKRGMSLGYNPNHPLGRRYKLRVQPLTLDGESFTAFGPASLEECDQWLDELPG